MLPGAAWVEKDAIYTNEQGRVQAASQAIAPPGEAREDWQILASLARSLGLSMPYQSSDDVRAAHLRGHAGVEVRRGRAAWRSRGRCRRSNWLQASNPSERWKWDFLYQDLPPVKGHNVQMEGEGASPSFIPLKPVD